jgi:ribosomal protein L7/L12
LKPLYFKGEIIVIIKQNLSKLEADKMALELKQFGAKVKALIEFN